jgi:ribosomal protein S12 methylthiotransferase accessory factor
MPDGGLRIVYLGPSLSLDRAKATLPTADFRPPIKRGDLADVAPGAVVGIIDGVFAQTLAISPGEIRDAICRGVRVYGAASMGALRAAEVPEVIGVGHVYEMYRSKVIDRDDEVAVMLRSDTFAALTEPLVNVRFAVERLVRTGTLNRADGEAIIDAASNLHFTQRNYRAILAASTLASNKDIDDIIALLKRFDLKADDAQLLLEMLAEAEPQRGMSARPPQQRQRNRYARVNRRETGDAPILIWESGDSVQFTELVRFLKVTGAFEIHAAKVISQLAAARTPLAAQQATTVLAPQQSVEAAQSLLDRYRAQWGWESPEEAHVTMRDLGLGLDDVADSLEAEAAVRHLMCELGKAPTEEFSKALRVQLWRDKLALKREALRLGALQYFAAEGARGGPPDADELLTARRCIAKCRKAFRWESVVSSLNAIGVTQAELASVTEQFALARRAGAQITAIVDRPPVVGAPAGRKDRWRDLPLALEPSAKAAGSSRFSLTESAARDAVSAIADQIGVVRIGLVGELDNLGIHIAQAFGQRSGWSSSFSSGKSETRDGARVGSVMEEVEIFAQDRYIPAAQIHTSFTMASAQDRLVDPLELGLPYDSRYSAELQTDWAPCIDLVSGDTVYVPTASLVGERQLNDIFYSPRLGGKIFSSSGLGSGFSLAEAIVHAAAEYIERHAYRLAEIEIDNPGGVGARTFRFVGEASLPDTPASIVGKYRRAGVFVRIVDITSEIAVPTFWVRIFDDPFKSFHSSSADGFACHPDPEVALTMALLEAAQTRGGYIAGGREDYSLHARSLGRHERPRTALPRSQAFWFADDPLLSSFDATAGLHADDILDELEFLVDRVVRAGFPSFLVADYTIPEIRPAYAVRVLIPGLEVTNPLFTGPRARATVLRDILPNGYHAG